jgi:4-alpha-glucanotransferase
VATASVDVWRHLGDFDQTHTVGCPPDAFNEDGQEWGLPAPRWEVMAQNDFSWWRARLRRALALFDALRIDHVIGLFRTFVVPLGKTGRDGHYEPTDEGDQERQGKAVLDALLRESGPGRLVAEDLGWPPKFILPALQARDIPGYQLMRWVTVEGSTQLLDPAAYPECSLASTGTHDTSTLASWWETELTDAERAAIVHDASRGTETEAPARLTDKVRRVLLHWILSARSRLVVLPIQDIFAWKQRFNEPGTVGPKNWTWRMPVAVEHLLADKRTKVQSAELREAVRANGR